MSKTETAVTLVPDTLIEQARKGSASAFNRLVQAWYKRIYNFCLKYMGDHDTAMEATQQTFISAHRHLPELRDTKLFKSWLYRIALNSCHQEARRKKRGWLSVFGSFGNGDDNQLPFVDMATNLPDPEEKLGQAEISEWVMKALGEINSEQRTVVIMKEFEGMKFREIAEVLQISENTAKSRLYYGLTAMRKILEKWNISKASLYER